MTTPPTGDPAPFAATLRAVRSRSGQSQAVVAKKAGLTASYLSMLESGRKPPPSDPVVKRLARALGLEPPFLLEIAHLERTPEDIRDRMAGLSRSLEAEKKVTRKVLRGPLLEVFWHFLSWSGFKDSSLESLRLSRRTHRLARRLARDARAAASSADFREKTSEVVETLDSAAAAELIDAMPELTRAPETPSDGSATDLPVRTGLVEDGEGDTGERLPAPAAFGAPGLFWFRVGDQDMYPRVQEGDCVLMAPGARPGNGDLVGVRLGDRDTVRIYMDLPGGAEMTAANASLPPLRPGPGAEIVAVARWLSRPLGADT